MAPEIQKKQVEGERYYRNDIFKELQAKIGGSNIERSPESYIIKALPC